MNYTVTTSPDIGSDSANNVGNGTYNVGVSGLSYNTTYTWQVNVTDGTNWANKTCTFTVEELGAPSFVATAISQNAINLTSISIRWAF